MPCSGCGRKPRRLANCGPTGSRRSRPRCREISRRLTFNRPIPRRSTYLTTIPSTSGDRPPTAIIPPGITRTSAMDLDTDSALAFTSAAFSAAIEALGGGIPEPFFMSVGFFETHRSFFAPSSVRDRVYSLPPPFLPDTPEIRQDIAAYKASARSLDHGVGAVLNTLHETEMDRNTLVICTPDHDLAFPTAKASLLDRKSTRLNSSHLGISYAV